MLRFSEDAKALKCSKCLTWQRSDHVLVLELCEHCAEHEMVSLFYSGTGSKQRPRARWMGGRVLEKAKARGLDPVRDWNAAYCSRHDIPCLVLRWSGSGANSPDFGETGLVPEWVSVLLGIVTDIQRAGKRKKVPWKWPEILQLARDDEEFRDALLVMCEMDDSESRIATVADFLFAQWEMREVD